MNFFYHNDDPLLSRYGVQSNLSNDGHNNINDAYAQLYKQQLLQEMQQQGNVQEIAKDWVGELDDRLKRLKPNVIAELNNDAEFAQLNATVQSEIQREIISLVKYKLNASPTIKENIKKQMGIIDRLLENTEEEERRNMMELNDYMKNYSHLTFDEYKKIKNGETVESK